MIESDLDVLKDGLVMVGNVINSSRDDEGWKYGYCKDFVKRSWRRKGYGCGFGIEVFYTFSVNESYLKGWVKSLAKCLDPFLNCGIIVDGDLSSGLWR